jgi:magnesium chelatase family protein
MTGAWARRTADLSSAAETLLGRAVDRFGLTGRGFDRALKVARTVADLDGSRPIDAEHVVEALAFRGEAYGDEEPGVA